MTERKGKSGTIDVKGLLAGDEEFLRALVRTALQGDLYTSLTQRPKERILRLSVGGDRVAALRHP
jgi:hypothetical protein